MSKGSHRRPMGVSQAQFKRNWERAFGRVIRPALRERRLLGIPIRIDPTLPSDTVKIIQPNGQTTKMRLTNHGWDTLTDDRADAHD